MTRPVVAASAIVVHDGALLLVERGAAPSAGKWSVPGGRVEFGETVRDAVVREVREETGIDVAVGAFAGWSERIITAEGTHYVIFDFFSSVLGSTALTAGDDAADARWVPLPEVAHYDLSEGLLDFLVSVGTVLP